MSINTPLGVEPDDPPPASLFDVPFEDDGLRRNPKREAPAADPVESRFHPLEQSLPADFPLAKLLTFLPDPKLKQRLDQEASAALAINVHGADGLVAADKAVARVRSAIAVVMECFSYPCELAFKLHRRLTGLRGEFVTNGESAVKILNERIYNEKRRLDRIALDDQRRLQAEADAEAKRLASEEARKQGLPEEVVSVIEQQTASITVPVAPTPDLTYTSTTERWKARLIDSPDDNRQPESYADMTVGQRAAFAALIAAVHSGAAPINLLRVNWQAAHDRAKSDRDTMTIPGLEAYDAGGVRAKGMR